MAPKAVYPKLLQIKQAADLHTPGYNQRLVAEVMKDGFLTAMCPPSARCTSSGAKPCWPRSTKEMQGLGVHWNARWRHVPVGAPAGRHERHRAAAQGGGRNVAFVPGAAFYADNADQRTLRLSFVTSTVEQIATGIAALAAAIREHKG